MTQPSETSTDRIEKQIVLPAPRERVWRALTDVREFNQWFGVSLEAPFAPGAEVSGRIVHKGYEHVVARMWVETMEAPTRFAFRWHPHAIQAGVDYSQEPTTLVTFTLEPAEGGTLLRVVESGFDAIPESRRATAFQSNAKGWAGQLENIRKHLDARAA
jgi:uncharacterized protein YndB with AHSA1/START domain